jgi:hypothetical protein
MTAGAVLTLLDAFAVIVVALGLALGVLPAALVAMPPAGRSDHRVAERDVEHGLAVPPPPGWSDPAEHAEHTVLDGILPAGQRPDPTHDLGIGDDVRAPGQRLR